MKSTFLTMLLVASLYLCSSFIDPITAGTKAHLNCSRNEYGLKAIVQQQSTPQSMARLQISGKQDVVRVTYTNQNSVMFDFQVPEFTNVVIRSTIPWTQATASNVILSGTLNGARIHGFVNGHGRLTCAAEGTTRSGEPFKIFFEIKYVPNR